MNRLLFLIFLFTIGFFGFASCNQSKTETVQNRTVFQLHTPGDYVVVEQNIVDNYMLIKSKHNSETISICGGGNLDFCYNQNGSIVIDTARFDETGAAYVLPLYVKGSTYGAEETYIIYKEYQQGLYWLVYKIPFDRIEICDVNGDGFSEIIAHDGEGGHSYSFCQGLLINGNRLK